MKINSFAFATPIDALEHIQANREVRALVLTGDAKSFCAGGDIAAMEKRFDTPSGVIAFNWCSRQRRVHCAQSLSRTMPISTIAAVNGAAAGLGADMALARDFVIPSTGASFAWSYTHTGFRAPKSLEKGKCKKKKSAPAG